MSLQKTWNNTNYNIPESGNRGWSDLTDFLTALADGAQSTGKQLIGRRVASTSPVTVTATTDAYVGVNVVGAAATVNLPAGVNGQVFIIADESDAANTYNITINPNGSNTINSTTSYVLNQNSQACILVHSGGDWVIIHTGTSSAPISSVTDSSKIDFTLTAGNLTATIVPASLVNADINASAAIAYSKLNLATSIVNADISASAAIARTKVASGSINHVVINDGSGVLSSEAQLATTRGGTGVSNAGTLTYGSNNVTLTTSGVTGVTLPTSGTLATLAGTEILTNKDYDGGTASNTSRLTVPKAATATLSALTRKQGTIVYDSSLNKLKYDDGSNLNLVGSGSSSSGGINYISNSDFEDGTITGWATYADAAATTPVDGTGGSPSSTFASSSSSPLRGTYSALWTKSAANRQGEGFSYAFTLSAADVSKTLQITFDSNASANMVSGDMGIYIYDVTNSTLITPSSVNLPTSLSSQYSLTFQATTSTSYRIIFHTATTSALAYTVQIDQISISPIVRPMVAGESDWIAYTPTFSAGFGTTTSASGFWRRIGDSMEVSVSVTAGTTAASLATISLPGSYTINASKLSLGASTTSNNCNIVGVGASGGNTICMYILAAPATSTSVVYLGNLFGAAANPLVPANGTAVVTSSQVATYNFKLPITQWSSNITLASTAPMIEYVYNTSTTDAADTTSFGYGAAGIAGVIATTNLTGLRNKRVRFQNAIQPTDRIQIEIKTSTGSWTQLAGTDSGLGICPLAYQNAGIYGIGLASAFINSTDIDVAFGTYAYPNGATFGAAGLGWSSVAAARWRIAKYSSIGVTELAPATSTSSGTITRENTWTAYTPTYSAGYGTVTNNVAYYKVLGDSLYLRGFATTGTVAASLASITIPSGFTISTSKIRNSTTGNSGTVTGTYSMQNLATASGAVVLSVSTSTSLIYFAADYTSINALTPANGSTIFQSSKDFSWQCEVPLV